MSDTTSASKPTPSMVENASAKAAGTPHLKPLLVSREQMAEMLGGVSTSTIVRLEKQGRLTPVRLTRKPTSMVFYTVDNVHRVIADALADVPATN